MSRFLGLDRSALWLLGRLLALWVRPTVLPVDEAERLRGRGRRVVYVLENDSLTDLLALQIACWKLGLPSPTRPLATGGVREPANVALQRTRGWGVSRIDARLPARLRRIVTGAVVARDFDVDFVPVSVFWGRAPGRERGWFRLMLAEDWTLVGRTRRVLSTFVNGRSTLVHFGDPEPLGEFAGAGLEASRTVRRVARRMRHEFRTARTATIGPDLSHRRTMIAEVLMTRGVRAAVGQEMRDRRVGRRQALETARRYAYEIAADYSHRFVRFMDALLTRLWTRLYDGVEVLHADRLAAAGDGAQLVYVPCHRSHMDYLLLSYVIYYRGFAVPHIAAGVNLNLPVIGRFLRKGGAFFLRRSFKGNALYPSVFTAYLQVLMQRGHSVEYFVEGGRSRTGRLLRPKTGMLSMTVRGFLKDARRPVVFVPVFFAYERLFEEKTYVGELSGRSKEKESVLGLLRALPKLRERFGRVYVSFGEPLDLATHLAGVEPAWREALGGDARPPWLARAVESLAERVQQRVNAAVAVSPVALLALALLSTPRQAMPEQDLLRQLELYRKLAARAPYSPDLWCTPLDAPAIVEYGRGLGILESVPHPLGTVVRMSEPCAILAAYYRNNVLHAYALPSLVACAFVNNAEVATADLQRLVGRIYPYVAQELFLRWPEVEVAAEVGRQLAALAELGLLVHDASADVWRRPATGTAEAVQLSVLANAMLPTVERFYLAVALLLQVGPGAVTQEALENRCHLAASRIALLYELRAPEFFDKALFRQFLDLLREREVVATGPEGRLVYDRALVEVAADARIVLAEQIRHSILQVTHA